MIGQKFQLSAGITKLSAGTLKLSAENLKARPRVCNSQTQTQLAESAMVQNRGEKKELNPK